MELRKGPISVFSLIFNALKTANLAFGSVLSLFILILLCFALIIGILIGANFLLGPRWLMILYIPASVLMGFLNITFTMAVIQILAAKMEKRGYSAWESFTASLLPSLYFIASSLIIAVVFFAILFCAKLAHSSWVSTICLVVLALAALPFMFTQSVLALRDEGPISALKYSWELGSKNYFRILLVLITMVLCFTLFFLAVGCAVKAFAPQLIFMLAQYINPFMFYFMTWQTFLLLVIIYAIGLYFYLFTQAVITGLFLNLDYTSRPTESRQIDMQAQTLQTKPAPGSNVMQEVSVTQASIKTDSMENTDQHLDQVYKAQEHLAQAIEQEEDRMPTILFDDDMARQLAAAEEQMRRQQEQSAKDKDDNEPKSVKMSDKPL